MAKTAHRLTCLGRDGVEREFYCEVPEEPYERCVTFRVRKAESLDDEFFELTLTRCTDVMWRITAITNNSDPRYIKMGIADALIPKAARLLKAAIRSSSKTKPESGSEFLTPYAERMWERLKKSGLTRYCPVGGYYIYDEGNRVGVCARR